MRSPQSLRDGGGDTLSPSPPPPSQHRHRGNITASPHDIRFHSTLSVHKLKRFNSVILLFRVATFVFSLSSFVFMLTNSRSPPHWFDFDAFRFVLAANGIVAVYSLVEMVASVWEITTGATLFPEVYQVWFDFGHDQVFAYLLLSAGSAGTALVKTLRGTETCTGTTSFCIQSDISIALGFAGFIFLSLSSLMSGFRVACFLINGSRFHL